MKDFSNLQTGDWIRLSNGAIIPVVSNKSGYVFTMPLSFNYDGTLRLPADLSAAFGDPAIVEQVDGPPVSITERDEAAAHTATEQVMGHAVIKFIRVELYRASALTGILAHSGAKLRAEEVARLAVEAADALAKQPNPHTIEILEKV